MSRGHTRKALSKKFCHCIKQVRKTIKTRGSKEVAAIAVCVKSVLGSRGRTLRKFTCGKNRFLETQNIIKK